MRLTNLQVGKSSKDSNNNMSEGCTSCRGANFAGGCLKFGGSSGGGGSGNGSPGDTGCGSCCSSSTANKANCCNPSKMRVQVRAKVLYGSGKAIASLKAQEKAARR